MTIKSPFRVNFQVFLERAHPAFLTTQQFLSNLNYSIRKICVQLCIQKRNEKCKTHLHLQFSSFGFLADTLDSLYCCRCCYQIMDSTKLIDPLQVDALYSGSYQLKVYIFECLRFVKTFPCVAVYMSSLTNMAIAADRYRVIVRSNCLQVILNISFFLRTYYVLFLNLY